MKYLEQLMTYLDDILGQLTKTFPMLHKPLYLGVAGGVLALLAVLAVFALKKRKRPDKKYETRDVYEPVSDNRTETEKLVEEAPEKKTALKSLAGALKSKEEPSAPEKALDKEPAAQEAPSLGAQELVKVGEKISDQLEKIAEALSEKGFGEPADSKSPELEIKLSDLAVEVSRLEEAFSRFAKDALERDSLQTKRLQVIKKKLDSLEESLSGSF